MVEIHSLTGSGHCFMMIKSKTLISLAIADNLLRAVAVSNAVLCASCVICNTILPLLFKVMVHFNISEKFQISQWLFQMHNIFISLKITQVLSQCMDELIPVLWTVEFGIWAEKCRFHVFVWKLDFVNDGSSFLCWLIQFYYLLRFQVSPQALVHFRRSAKITPTAYFSQSVARF